MKKSFFTILLTLVAVSLFADIIVPNVGNGRIRVVGNNLLNYYYNYAESERPTYSDDQGLAYKTQAIVDMIIGIDADIYAFCEVEAKPIVLNQLVDSVNKWLGGTYFAAVEDGIYVETDSYDNALKSGFIYRVDKVKPYGSNQPASTYNYYKNTMRIQAFEELSTGERFTLSMNHFKAKSTYDDHASDRVSNANQLFKYLPSYASDEDILIMGDLNATMEEECISIIQDKGYEEQLLRFDSASYSYCWNYSGQLIDHAFANASMAKQITGAAVVHVNNANCNCYKCYSYSDHDPYLVAMNLGEQQQGGGGEDECEDFSYSESFASSLGGWEVVNVEGSSNWRWYSSYYCAYMNAYQTYPDDDYLISPALDLSGQKNGKIGFKHALGYGLMSEWSNVCTLEITDDYAGDVAEATWTQLTIPNWGSSYWSWAENSIDIPEAYMGKKNVRVAFHYNAQKDEGAGIDTQAPAWEIQNVTVTAECDVTTSEEPIDPQDAVDDIHGSESAIKVIENGQLYILRDGVRYNIFGMPLK